MKYRIWRYILVICLCAIGGGLSAVTTGPVGIFRGAALGALLAAAFPAIDYLKSKGKCQSVCTNALLLGIPVASLLIVPQIDSNDNPSNQQGEKVS